MELHNDDGDRMTPRTMLGRRLRRARETAEQSLRELAEQVGYPHTYIGRVERGEQLPSKALAEALDANFNMDGLFMELLKLAHDTAIPTYSRDVLNKEPESERIQVFASSLIPGLLQTEGYAWELFRKSLPGTPEETLAGHVDIRMQRQSLLKDAESPFYWAIMDEAALKRPIGGTKCMLGQLQHLQCIAQNPRITVQVVPFTEGAHPMLGGCLTLLTLRDGTSVAFVESFNSGEMVESTKRVVELTQRFDMARSLALSEANSLDLIQTHMEEYKNADDT
jgi:transcriptional regulator with XRE-family HTH domain